MNPDELPPDVLALISGPVRTLAHLELLLAVYARRPEPCTSEEAARATVVTTLYGARRALAELAGAGLLERSAPDAWRFAPRGADVEAGVASLADAYDHRTFPLMRALSGRPTKPLQSFADAFRLRDDR